MWVVPCASLPLLSGKHSISFFAIATKFTEIFNRYERPAGLFITGYVYIVYLMALRFEGQVFFFFFCILKSKTHLRLSRPFTDMIYSTRAEKAKTL